jgi:hypothetical protein
MNDTRKQGRKLQGSLATARLLRMLQSMSRSFPQTMIRTTSDGIGVYLADGRCLSISTSGHFQDRELSDLLALFVVWLRADPEGLGALCTGGDGLSYEETTQSEQSVGPQSSTLHSARRPRGR